MPKKSNPSRQTLYTHANPEKVHAKPDKQGHKYVKMDERTWVLKPIHNEKDKTQR